MEKKVLVKLDNVYKKFYEGRGFFLYIFRYLSAYLLRAFYCSRIYFKEKQQGY